MMSGPKIKF